MTEPETAAPASQLIRFNDVDLDVDVMELNGWELSQIKKKAGFSYRELLAGLAEFDGDAIRALFWIAEVRHRPELAFSDYRGPTLGFVMRNVTSLAPQADNDESDGDGTPGKETGETTPTGPPGSPSSPSASDGPDANTTT